MDLRRDTGLSKILCLIENLGRRTPLMTEKNSLLKVLIWTIGPKRGVDAQRTKTRAQ